MSIVLYVMMTLAILVFLAESIDSVSTKMSKGHRLVCILNVIVHFIIVMYIVEKCGGVI